MNRTSERTVASQWLAGAEDRVAAAVRGLAVALFILLIAAGAHVRFYFPGNPVPVTLQTFFVLLTGAFLGARRAALALAGYIALGVAGAPFFAGAGPSGLAYFAGPTGGYLAGFFVGALVLGLWTRRAKHWPAVLLAFAFCDFLVLTCGTAHLALTLGLGWRKAWATGFAPFVYGDAVKTAAACLLFTSTRSLVSPKKGPAPARGR